MLFLICSCSGSAGPSDHGDSGGDAGSTGADSAGGTPANGGSGTAEGGVGALAMAGNGASLAGSAGTTGVPCPTASQSTFMQPTVYAFDSLIHSCLQGSGDEDFYRSPFLKDVAGGYITVTISEVGQELGDPSLDALDVTVYIGALTEPVFTVSQQPGTDLKFWFATNIYNDYEFRIRPTSLARGGSSYALRSEYHGVPDVFEPNDYEEQATELSLDSPVQAYFSSGLPTPYPADYYKIALTAGQVQVRITDLPLSMPVQVYMYKPLSIEAIGGGESTLQAPDQVSFTASVLSADEYYLKILPVDSRPKVFGTGGVPADFLTRPYSIRITQ